MPYEHLSHLGLFTFNSTLEELKSYSGFELLLTGLSFNSTLEELKCNMSHPQAQGITAFNSTLEELK